MFYIIYGYFSGPVTELSSVSDTACSMELTFLSHGRCLPNSPIEKERPYWFLGARHFGIYSKTVQAFTERFVPSVEKYIRLSWASLQRRVESLAF